MPTISNFIQLFHFSNWTKTIPTGSITSNDPSSVVLKSSTTNRAVSTYMSIQIPINGTITFTYAASSTGFLNNSQRNPPNNPINQNGANSVYIHPLPRDPVQSEIL